MAEKTVEKMAGKLAELSKKLEDKQALVSELLLNGRDASKALSEQGALEQELSAVRMALEESKRREASQGEEQLKQERERVAGEVLKLRAQAYEAVCVMLEEALSIRGAIASYYEIAARINTLSRLYGLNEQTLLLSQDARYVSALRGSIHKLVEMLKLQEHFSPTKLTDKYAPLFRD